MSWKQKRSVSLTPWPWSSVSPGLINVYRHSTKTGLASVTSVSLFCSLSLSLSLSGPEWAVKALHNSQTDRCRIISFSHKISAESDKHAKLMHFWVHWCMKSILCSWKRLHSHTHIEYVSSALSHARVSVACILLWCLSSVWPGAEVIHL